MANLKATCEDMILNLHDDAQAESGPQLVTKNSHELRGLPQVVVIALLLRYATNLERTIYNNEFKKDLSDKSVADLVELLKVSVKHNNDVSKKNIMRHLFNQRKYDNYSESPSLIQNAGSSLQSLPVKTHIQLLHQYAEHLEGNCRFV